MMPMEPSEAVVTGLRLWLGIVMLAHGVNHGRSLEGTADWFAKKGFRQPALNARASAAGELAIGTALVIGLATPLAAAGVVTIMTVAFWAIHRRAGFFVFNRPDEGWEYVATVVVASLVLATLGPGPWSVDAALGWDRFDGWTGLGIASLGFVAAAGQLAAMWRRP